jgi:hypothetical protein
MMLRRPVYIVLATTGLLTFGLAAQAAVVFEHVGANDPENEGWTRKGTPGFADATGKPNWRQQYESGSNIYRIVGTLNNDGSTPIEIAYEDPSGWTATADIQLLAGAEDGDAIFVAQDGSNHFHIRLYDGQGTTPAGAYAWWQSAIEQVQIGTVDPTDGFHTYQIVLDPGADTSNTSITGRADDIIRYYVDGVEDLTLLRTALTITGGRAEIYVGRTHGDPDPTDLLNALTRLETGQNPCTLGDGLCPDGSTWNTDVVGNWNTPANWTPGGPPIATDAALINSDGAVVTVDDSQPTADNTTVTAGELAIDAGGVLTSPLTLNGSLLTGSGTIVGNVTVINGGTLSPGSSVGPFVSGDSQLSIPEPASGLLGALGMIWLLCTSNRRRFR